MKQVALYSALAGLVVPLLFVCLAELEIRLGQKLIPSELLQLLLWPSSFLLLLNKCADCSAFSQFGFLLLTISTAMNVVLYAALGTAGWFVFRCFNR